MLFVLLITDTKLPEEYSLEDSVSSLSEITPNTFLSLSEFDNTQIGNDSLIDGFKVLSVFTKVPLVETIKPTLVFVILLFNMLLCCPVKFKEPDVPSFI